MKECFLSTNDANELLVTVVIAVGLFMLFYIKNRDSRWVEASRKSSPLLKLEQITHPHMNISGYGDLYVKFIDERSGKKVVHKVYCLTVSQQRELAEIEKSNGRNEIKIGARGFDEWKNWEIPSRFVE